MPETGNQDLERLRADVALLQQLLDRLPDALFVRDRAGRYVWANVACQRMLGMGPDEPLVGRHFREVIDPSLIERVEQRDQRIRASGEPLWDLEMDWPLAGGTIPVMVSLFPLDDDAIGVIQRRPGRLFADDEHLKQLMASARCLLWEAVRGQPPLRHGAQHQPVLEPAHRQHRRPSDVAPGRTGAG